MYSDRRRVGRNLEGPQWSANCARVDGRTSPRLCESARPERKLMGEFCCGLQALGRDMRCRPGTLRFVEIPSMRSARSPHGALQSNGLYICDGNGPGDSDDGKKKRVTQELTKSCSPRAREGCPRPMARPGGYPGRLRDGAAAATLHTRTSAAHSNKRRSLHPWPLRDPRAP